MEQILTTATSLCFSVQACFFMTLEHSADGLILSGGGVGAIQSSPLLFCNGLFPVDAEAVRILKAVITSVTVDCSMHAYRYMSLLHT